jgi:hypothetical protein
VWIAARSPRDLLGYRLSAIGYRLSFAELMPWISSGAAVVADGWPSAVRFEPSVNWGE